MRWQDIETRYAQDDTLAIDRLLTMHARMALGFPALLLGSSLLRAAYDQFAESSEFRRDDAKKAKYAMVGALAGDWDMVGECTGGVLGTRVVIKKSFGDNMGGLARHLATIVRGRLPATHALEAMAAARLLFREPLVAVDPRLLVIAGHIFVRDIARADDAVAKMRLWLDGEDLELDTSRGVIAPADGEDPRVKIFERYQAELSEDAQIATALRAHAKGDPWDRSLEASRRMLEELVIRAFVARLPLPDGWDELVDPIVATWLGAEPPTAAARYRDLERLRPASVILSKDLSDALFGLVAPGRTTFEAMVQSGKLPPFDTGKFFKDDARKLIRYVASAIAARASEEAVMPAWLDFLSRRSPGTSSQVANEKMPLRWKHLLVIQAAITTRLGEKRDRSIVGRALQQIVTGA